MIASLPLKKDIRMKTNLITLALLLVSAGAFAQAANLNNSTKPTPTDRPVDGYYVKNNILNAKVTPYANLRESDVMFSKRVWREMDLRDKQNMVFASPKGRLIDVLMEAVMAGELTAYDATSTKDDVNGDEFSTILKPEEAMSKFADSVLVPVFDADGNQTGTEVKPGEFNPDSVVKFRIKEDWIFDKQRSVFEPRIIGIAPMVKVKAAGQVLDDQPAFWIYFPEARQLLVTKEVVNRRNDATGLSYDDVFMKRLFASYVVKESNPEDLRIKDYALGIDKLYESERVKKELMDREHDLWSY
jgi:gliding motility associated protien GldN